MDVDSIGRAAVAVEVLSTERAEIENGGAVVEKGVLPVVEVVDRGSARDMAVGVDEPTGARVARDRTDRTHSVHLIPNEGDVAVRGRRGSVARHLSCIVDAESLRKSPAQSAEVPQPTGRIPDECARVGSIRVKPRVADNFGRVIDSGRCTIITGVWERPKIGLRAVTKEGRVMNAAAVGVSGVPGDFAQVINRVAFARDPTGQNPEILLHAVVVTRSEALGEPSDLALLVERHAVAVLLQGVDDHPRSVR